MQHNNNVDYLGASQNRAERAPESSRLHDPNVDRQIQITTKTTKTEALHLDLAFTAFSHTNGSSNSALDSCVNP